ncbi:unnamed protein product [Dicrocoelium dendriticum]|nr:unnamed protein product [Dicrocoelium dendriticum]
MSTGTRNFAHSNSGPEYQNWLAPQKSTDLADNRERNLELRAGLKLSTRRGPEAELYDVAGVHLLTSTAATSCNARSYSLSKRLQKWSARLASLLSTQDRAKRKSNCDVPVVLANKTINSNSADPTEFTLGRLPTKLRPRSGDYTTTSVHPPSATQCKHPTGLPRSNIDGNVCPPFWRCTPCLSSNPHHPLHRHLSVEQWSYYKSGFSLAHRRTDVNSFILILSLVAVAQLVLLLLTTSPARVLDQHSSEKSITLLPLGECSRLVLLCSSIMLAFIGLLCANWDKIAPSKHIVQELSNADPFTLQHKQRLDVSWRTSWLCNNSKDA